MHKPPASSMSVALSSAEVIILQVAPPNLRSGVETWRAQVSKPSDHFLHPSGALEGMDASPCDIQALLWNSLIAGGLCFWPQEFLLFAFLFVLYNTYSDTLAPTLWLPDMKNLLIGKDPDARKDWRQKKGVTKDDIVRWHHWLNGHESEHGGQRSLACCSPWCH